MQPRSPAHVDDLRAADLRHHHHDHHPSPHDDDQHRPPVDDDHHCRPNVDDRAHDHHNDGADRRGDRPAQAGPVGIVIQVHGRCPGLNLAGDAVGLYRVSDGALVDVKVQLGNLPQSNEWDTTLTVKATATSPTTPVGMPADSPVLPSAYEIRLFCDIGSSFRGPNTPLSNTGPTLRSQANAITPFTVTSGTATTISTTTTTNPTGTGGGGAGVGGTATGSGGTTATGTTTTTLLATGGLVPWVLPIGGG